jgi:hypothetical protein
MSGWRIPIRGGRVGRKAIIQQLEARRLLTNYLGTPGPDVISVFTTDFGDNVHVVINGTENVTSGDVFVFGDDGNDTLYLGPQLQQTFGGRILELSMGNGDDYITNFNPASSTGSLDSIDQIPVIVGGAGNDTISIDDEDGHVISDYRFSDESTTDNLFDLRFRHGAGFIEDFQYKDVEQVELFENGHRTDTYLDEKPVATRVSVSGGDGDDQFFATNGDFAAHGWGFADTTVGGGAGEDHIEFLDNGSPSDSPLTIAGLTISRGPAGFTYLAIEEQEIRGNNNVLTINGPSSFVTHTDVNVVGGTINLFSVSPNTFVNSSAATVNIGNGNLGALGGTVTLDLSSVNGDHVTVNDQADTGNDNYFITASQVRKAAGATTQATINFSGVENLQLLANQDGNNIFVQSTASGTPVTVGGGGGADSFIVGNGNVGANLLGPVTINGDAGSNTIDFDNHLDTSISVQTLDGATFTDGQPHTISSVSSILIENGNGGGTLNLVRVTVFTSASSGGNQTVNVGGGNLDSNLLADCSVSSATVLNIDDRLDSGNDGYLEDQIGYRKTTAGAHVVGYSTSIGTINLQANNGNNTVQVNFGQNNMRFFGNGGNDQFIVADTQPLFTLETIGIDTGAEQVSSVEPFGDYVTVNSDAGTSGDVGAKVRLLADDVIRRLTVNTVGTFQVPTSVTAQVGELFIPGGTIDLAGGALLSKPDGPSLATLTALLSRGFNHGNWNGTSPQGAINSSLAAGSSLPDAIGYGLGSQIAINAIGSFAISPNDVLLRYTRYGDTDLNQRVDFDDYVRTDNGFNNHLTSWVNGDFDYNGVVNFDDYVLIDLAFNMR